MCDKGLVTPNDILRRLRYVFDYNDAEMMSLFAFGGMDVSRAEVSDWLKREDNPDYLPLTDAGLSTFLNGLIIAERGARDDGPPAPETTLNYNAVLRKLKIALELRAEDIVGLLELGGHRMSKHELSAFFRKPEHRQYRECQGQVLRKFLRGLQLHNRGESPDAGDDAGDSGAEPDDEAPDDDDDDDGTETPH